MHGNLGDGAAAVLVVGCTFALFGLAAFIADHYTAWQIRNDLRWARSELRAQAHAACYMACGDVPPLVPDFQLAALYRSVQELRGELAEVLA